MSKNISEKFPFRSNYISIRGSDIHYIDKTDCAECETVFLYLHGNPTSSYLWRNIIPALTPFGRSIAPDLIGFGKSDKPDIEYTYQDHLSYITDFIEKLELKNIVLVLHDWGGAIGFQYAKLHPENVKGVVFMETFWKPMEWSKYNPLTRWLLKQLRDPKTGKKWNGRFNFFLRFVLPFSIHRRLTKKEKETYKKPFQTLESRKPVIKFPQELPFRGDDSLNEKMAHNYFKWLQKTKIPKLLLYAEPGILIKKSDVDHIKEALPNLTAMYIGKGKHYIQEDQPENIGKAIKKWYTDLFE